MACGTFVCRLPVRQTATVATEVEGQVPVSIAPEIAAQAALTLGFSYDTAALGFELAFWGHIDEHVDIVKDIVRPHRAIAVANTAATLVGLGRTEGQLDGDEAAVAGGRNLARVGGLRAG